MARLREFESKKIFAKAGIPVPVGHVVWTQEEAAVAAQELGFPLVAKVQVLTASRFKKGFIRIVDSKEDFSAALEELFSRHQETITRCGLLLEQKCQYRQELYVSVVSDESSASPLMLLNTAGGVDVEEAGETIRRCQIDILEGITDHDCQALTEGVKDGSTLFPTLKKIYALYRSFDCSLLEVNPLVKVANAYVALDAKIIMDSDALFRHQDAQVQVTEENLNRPPTALEIAAATVDDGDYRGTVHIAELDYQKGKGVSIGVDCVGTGVSLAVMDELMDRGYIPANFGDTSGNPPASKLYRATKLIFSQKDIEGFVFASCVSSQQLDNTARGIIKALKELYPATQGKPTIPCVFLFRGAWDKEAIALFNEHGISDSANVVMLGREATEYDVARVFDRLYKKRKEAVTDGR